MSGSARACSGERSSPSDDEAADASGEDDAYDADEAKEADENSAELDKDGAIGDSVFGKSRALPTP